MPELVRGRYRVRPAVGQDDLRAAQRLRWLCFIGQRRGIDAPDALDADPHDAVCRHLLIEDVCTGELVGCFRTLHLDSGAQIERSYSAQYYDLRRLRDFPGPMVEVGRFCIAGTRSDPAILRLAWAALAHHVDATGAKLLFGCSSFPGTDPAAFTDAFALLHARHLAPAEWRPVMKAPETVRFPPPACGSGARGARVVMPALLRSYLAMGGWVSDHAVLDRLLDTMHVFTGLEVAAIPPARARALRLQGH